MQPTFKAVGNTEGRSHPQAQNISSYAEEPYRLLSPFSYSEAYAIPVPGQTHLTARSVESIWQGLKIIEGNTNMRMFSLPPRKRRGAVEGHLYGSERIGLIEARKNIYRPAYFYHLTNHVPTDLTATLLSRGMLDERLYLYDVEENVNIEDSSSPLAHSTFAAEYYNDLLRELEQATKTKLLSFFDDSERESLAAPLAKALDQYQASDRFERLLIHRVSRAPAGDPFEKRFFDRLLERLASS